MLKPAYIASYFKFADFKNPCRTWQKASSRRAFSLSYRTQELKVSSDQFCSFSFHFAFLPPLPPNTLYSTSTIQDFTDKKSKNNETQKYWLKNTVFSPSAIYICAYKRSCGFVTGLVLFLCLNRHN